jgi:hypothetical protein
MCKYIEYPYYAYYSSEWETRKYSLPKKNGTIKAITDFSNFMLPFPTVIISEIIV